MSMGPREASPRPKGQKALVEGRVFLARMRFPTGLSSQQVPVPGTRQENGMATRLDEGLEDFFSRRVMDESSRCGTETHSHSPGPEAWKDSCLPSSHGDGAPGQSQSLGHSLTFSSFHT